MLILVKWLTRALGVLVVLIALGAGVIYFLAARSQLDYSERYRVSGIQSPVEIVRSEHNVPHIIADSDEDAFFGLGFAHAQDRLWQMTLWRRAAQGRLSEMFGSSTLDTDILMRSLDLYGLAADAVALQDRETRKALEAYSAGVNAWVNTINGGKLGKLAPEFLLFRSEFQPWTPADSLSILNLQGVRLEDHLELEIRRQSALNRLPAARVADLLPMDPEVELANVAAELGGSGQFDPAALIPESQASVGDVNAGLFQPQTLFGKGPGGASNAWAVSPHKTGAESSILANDPHLGFSAPSIWMLARLELSHGGVIGATIPGVPLIILGRSAEIAWGLTYARVDNQDLYFEKLDPENADRHLTPNGYENFRGRETHIPIKDAQPHIARLMWTENGPVIGPEHFGIGDILPEGYRISLAWTLLNQNNTTMSGAYGVMTATSLDEALEAGDLVTAPAFNLIVADQDDVVERVIGSVPLRSIFHKTRGLTPSEGWKYRNRWQGVLPSHLLPLKRNPPEGYVANTNNKTSQHPFPFHLSYDWEDTLRIQRLRNQLDASDVHSLESTIDLQNDVVSLAARTLLPNMARSLWHLADRETADTASQRRNAALQLLANWHGGMDQLSAAPLIYAAWIRSLQRLLAKDELGPIFARFDEPAPAFVRRVLLNINGAAQWCDIRQTSERETCDYISGLALDDALEMLSAAFGEDMSKWNWGTAHTAIHRHDVLGDTIVFSWLFNIYHPTPGGAHTLNRGYPGMDAFSPFANVHGPGYRAVYDFFDLDSSRFIISTGQSGHVLSRHYDDLGRLWSRGEYIPMTLDTELVRQSTIGVSLLEPSG